MNEPRCPKCDEIIFNPRFYPNDQMQCSQCHYRAKTSLFYKDIVSDCWLDLVSKTEEELALLQLFKKLSKEQKIDLFGWLQHITSGAPLS